MKQLIIALLLIAAGAGLVAVFLPRLAAPPPQRRYITLSGNVAGRTWAKKIPA